MKLLKKFFILLSFLNLTLFVSINSFAADTMVNPIAERNKAQFSQAKDFIGKKNYQEATVILQELLKDSDNAKDADILNYYAFSQRKLKHFDVAETYYLKALTIKPNHPGANEYLGELYLETKRPEKAKERLEVLKSCNCNEFKLLKANIDKYNPSVPFVPTSSW